MFHRVHLDRVLMMFDYARIDGWLLVPDDKLREIRLMFGDECVHVERSNIALPSPDIALHPACRFSLSLFLRDAGSRTDGRLELLLESGGSIVVPLEPATGSAEPGDPSRTAVMFPAFIDALRREGCRSVLEIGSRARRGISLRSSFDGLEYIGIDIVKDANVDYVVDAHRLSDVFGRHRFDAVFSLVVFEHLAMPWKVAVEMNRVMRPGGLAYINSVQTCGLHELPWDFFRFSDSAYRALFNRATGFEILQNTLSVPMHIFPFVHRTGFVGSERVAGWNEAEVLIRKIGETTLDWPVPLEDVISAPYPD
jgi:hypothetical protein